MFRDEDIAMLSHVVAVQEQSLALSKVNPLKEQDQANLKAFWECKANDKLFMDAYKDWVNAEKGRNSIQYAKLKGVKLEYFTGERWTDNYFENGVPWNRK